VVVAASAVALLHWTRCAGVAAVVPEVFLVMRAC
jgi:hypothetical protein